LELFPGFALLFAKPIRKIAQLDRAGNDSSGFRHFIMGD